MGLREAFSYTTQDGQVVTPTYAVIVAKVFADYRGDAAKSDGAGDPSNPHIMRRKKIEQRLRFYRDDYDTDAGDLVDLLFEHSDIKAQRKKYIALAKELNVTARVIDEKNVLYDWPAERTFKSQQVEWDALAEELAFDEFMGEAAKLTDLCRMALLWATESEATKKKSLRVITPDAFDVIPDPRDPLVVAGYLLDWPTAPFAGDAGTTTDALPQWRLWDDTVEIKISGAGHMVGAPREHGLGGIPGCLAHARRPVDRLVDTTTGDDITSAHKKVMFLNLLAARLAKSQGERQPILEGILANVAKGQAADGERPLLLPPEVRAYMLDTKTDPEHYLKLVRHTITGIGARYGISYEKFTFAETTSNSLRDLKLRDKKLAEIRRKQIPRWRAIERKLVKLLGFETQGFYWNPQEEAVPLEPGEDLDLLERKIKLGMDSAVAWMIRKDPELTREAAAKKVIQYVRDRALIVGAQRALNMPAKPTEPGQSPEQNGSTGSLARRDSDGTEPPEPEDLN